VFQLTSEQLAVKKHYDFGLRAIGSVLSLAGKIKLKVLRITNDTEKKQKVANDKIVDYIEGLRKIKVDKKAEVTDADRQKELLKNIPTGGLMKRINMMKKNLKRDEEKKKR
jgi:hypothetical protein